MLKMTGRIKALLPMLLAVTATIGRDARVARACAGDPRTDGRPAVGAARPRRARPARAPPTAGADRVGGARGRPRSPGPVIAQALFVTVHTVEVHLSHAYAKLGVRSRTQLAGRLTL